MLYIIYSLLTNEFLQVLRKDGTPDTNVWAVGDAAVIKDDVLPATAQGASVCTSMGSSSCQLLFEISPRSFVVAQQKAKYVTKVINRLAKTPGQGMAAATSKPFKFNNRGTLAYLGDWYTSFSVILQLTYF